MEAERFTEAWDQFFAAVRRARGRAAQAAQPGTLTLAQYQLLAALGDEAEMSAGDLAVAGGVAAPTATRMLASLERDGIVARRRSNSDGRRVWVSLTGDGRRMLRRKRKDVLAKQRSIYDSLSAEERRQAEAILRRLAVAVEDL